MSMLFVVCSIIAVFAAFIEVALIVSYMDELDEYEKQMKAREHYTRVYGYYCGDDKNTGKSASMFWIISFFIICYLIGYFVIFFMM